MTFSIADLRQNNDGGCPEPDYLPERNDIIIYEHFASPFLLRSASNTSSKFEPVARFRVPARSRGRRWIFEFRRVELQRLVVSFLLQRNLSPRRQHLRQPNSRRYPFQCFRLHCISLSEFSFCLETLEKEGGIWEIRLLSIIITVVLFYCHLRSRSFHSLMNVDLLFTIAFLVFFFSSAENSRGDFFSLVVT